MTINVCESNYQVPLDLVSKKPIKLDPISHDLLGQDETIITSAKDIFKVGHVVETERTSATTKMNQASSRTHCLIWIKVYTKMSDNLVHVNHMRFIDLAGSERVGKTGAEKKMDKLYAEAIMINYSLTVFARVIFGVTNLKKPIENGAKIPDKTCWKETAITRILKTSFNGQAFSSFLFCISQAESNSGESWSTMNFAEQCSILKTKITRPKPIKIKANIDEEEKAMAIDKKQLEKLK